ncbi:MAG: hypothetical protein NZ602_13275, partial [Thermoguttaceae bacterium]|nr:hypothetical protein [Thermoguttaceae bacterium]
MHYRNIATLTSQLAQWWDRLPQDIELIVGIPRSGLLVANLLALFRNLPVADLEGFLQGRLLASGRRCPDVDRANFLAQPRTVLVVDDSILSGDSLAKARQTIQQAHLPHRIYYAAVYVAPDRTQEVDFYCELVPPPVAYEWNLLHHPVLQEACVDIDGVLCRNPTPEEDDDGPRYEQFLREVHPLCIPSVPIGCLVTSRLEKYRELTEQWLAHWQIPYRRLEMLPLEDAAARTAFTAQAAFKAAVFRQMGEQLFIESSFQQAQEIAYLSRGPVLCIETQQIYTHETIREPPISFGTLRAKCWQWQTQGAVWGTVTPQALPWHLLPHRRIGRDWINEAGFVHGMRLALWLEPKTAAWQGLRRWMIRSYLEELGRYLWARLFGSPA